MNKITCTHKEDPRILLSIILSCFMPAAICFLFYLMYWTKRKTSNTRKVKDPEKGDLEYAHIEEEEEVLEPSETPEEVELENSINPIDNPHIFLSIND